MIIYLILLKRPLHENKWVRFGAVDGECVMESNICFPSKESKRNVYLSTSFMHLSCHIFQSLSFKNFNTCDYYEFDVKVQVFNHHLVFRNFNF